MRGQPGSADVQRASRDGAGGLEGRSPARSPQDAACSPPSVQQAWHGMARHVGLTGLSPSVTPGSVCPSAPTDSLTNPFLTTAKYNRPDLGTLIKGPTHLLLW